MPAAKQNILLVTPVYHDADRLSSFGPSLAEAFAASSLPVHWIVADDGSGEAQVKRVKELVERFRKVYPRVDFYEKGEHLGKGGTVRSAWNAHPDSDWVAFIDADGSVRADSLIKLLEKAVAVGPGHAVLASRMRDPGTTVVQKPLRKVAHRVFAVISRLVLGFPVKDPQCGAKVIDAEAFRAISPKLVEDGFAFDAELLVALREHRIECIEVPVDWMEKSGGSVSPFVQAWPMVSSLLRVRRRRSRGQYDPS